MKKSKSNILWLSQLPFQLLGVAWDINILSEGFNWWWFGWLIVDSFFSIICLNVLGRVLRASHIIIKWDA